MEHHVPLHGSGLADEVADDVDAAGETGLVQLRAGLAVRARPTVIEGDREPGSPGLAELVAEARALVAKGSRKRDAAATVARGTGIATGDVYAALLDERP